MSQIFRSCKECVHNTLSRAFAPGPLHFFPLSSSEHRPSISWIVTGCWAHWWSIQITPLLVAPSIHSLRIALLVTTPFLRELLSDHTLDKRPRPSVGKFGLTPPLTELASDSPGDDMCTALVVLDYWESFTPQNKMWLIAKSCLMIWTMQAFNIAQ